MDGQYEAAISQGGTNISGGQKQRIAIARAICRKPEIYIFDDSFSALDYKTDRQLRSVLKKETANTTSLIVAQRIGTIIDADKIIVLDEGKVVGIGTHKELLNTCTVYQEIAHSQLSKEELVS
jgi:ATP-binding cassette subfamily B protein